MGALRRRFAIALFGAAMMLLAARPSGAESITAVVPEVSGEAIAAHANTGTNILYITKAAANRVTVYNVSEVYVSNAGDGSLTIIQEDSLSTVTALSRTPWTASPHRRPSRARRSRRR